MKNKKGEMMEKKRLVWLMLSVILIATRIVYADGVDDLISKLDNANETKKMEIISQLVEVSDPRIVQSLIRSGKETDFKNYISLLYMSGKSVVVPCIQTMKNGNVKIRRFVTKIIGFTASTMYVFQEKLEISGQIRGVADSRAIQPLLDALKDDDKIVRMNAAGSLGMLGREDGLEVAISGLGDNNWEVVVAAANALGWIGNKRGSEALQKIYKTLQIDGEILTRSSFDRKEDLEIFDAINLSMEWIKYFSSDKHKNKERKMLEEHKDLYNISE